MQNSSGWPAAARAKSRLRVPDWRLRKAWHGNLLVLSRARPSPGGGRRSPGLRVAPAAGVARAVLDGRGGGARGEDGDEFRIGAAFEDRSGSVS